jgi:hypothetical protein
MGIFFDAPVEPDALTTYVRNVPADTGFRLTDLFPTRVHPNNTVDTAEITRTNRTARFRAFDGRLHVSSRDTGSIKQFKLPAVSSSLSMGEYERLQLLFAQTGGTNQAAIANAVYNDATNLTREVQARIEQAWGDVLTDGKLTIDEEGYITEADYGVPGSQIVSAGTAYTTIATATALADFITWCDTYNTNNGFLPGYFQTSLRVMRLLQQNAQIINAIAGAAATRSRVTNQEVADLFSSEGLPQALPPYDTNVDVDGTTTRVIADDKIMFFPPNLADLGHNAVGISATALELVNAAQSDLSFEEAAGIVGVVIKEGPPFRQFTFIDSVQAPVLDNAKLLMVADVI